jgi:hypothetical protein
MLLGGCAASGPKHAEIRQAIGPVDPDMGRIYFYRDSFLGFAIQPEIRLNGEVVGKSTPGGFFFVERRPGKYVASAATEVENRIELPGGWPDPLRPNQYVHGHCRWAHPVSAHRS